MTESTTDPVSASTGPRARDGRASATIDLRFPEAQWTYRQLQARVSHAHDLLAQAEADAEFRVLQAPATMEELDVNASLGDAHDVIVREWAETVEVSAARLAEADVEVRRIIETARAEVRALEEEAEFLRTHPVARIDGSRSIATVDHDPADPSDRDGSAPC